MNITWGNWDVRVYAAEAWVSLASRFAAEHPCIVDEIEAMLADSVPAVRLQVAQNLQVIYHAAPDRMWTMGERIVSQETNNEIIAAYLSQALGPFSHSDPDRCEAMLSIVIERLDGDLASDDRGRLFLEESLGNWCEQLVVEQGRVLPSTWLERWATDPQRYGRLLDSFLSLLREALFRRYRPGSDTDACALCDRAQESLKLILRSATTISCEAHGAYASSNTTEADKQAIRDRYSAAENLIRHAMNQLYFGSGAYQSDSKDEPGLPNIASMQSFLNDYLDILALLASSHEPGTLHHLVQLYEFLMSANPTVVFEAIYTILLGRGEEEGYHFESLGNAVVVRLVQRYIADHRAIFEDEGRRARLVAILQLFSHAGWPEALRLLYDLPDLLR